MPIQDGNCNHLGNLRIYSWYQMYGSLIPLSTFEKNCLCVTADYTTLNDESLSVMNACRLHSPDGLHFITQNNKQDRRFGN